MRIFIRSNNQASQRMKKQVKDIQEALTDFGRLEGKDSWQTQRKFSSISSPLALVCEEPGEFQSLMLLSYRNLDFLTISLISCVFLILLQWLLGFNRVLFWFWPGTRWHPIQCSHMSQETPVFPSPLPVSQFSQISLDIWWLFSFFPLLVILTSFWHCTVCSCLETDRQEKKRQFNDQKLVCLFYNNPGRSASEHMSTDVWMETWVTSNVSHFIWENIDMNGWFDVWLTLWVLV